MKPLIILSIIVVLCGAGCEKKKEQVIDLTSYGGLPTTTFREVGEANIERRIKKLEDPIMVTVQLKTPIQKSSHHACYGWPETVCEGKNYTEYSTTTSMEIPLQEFVDLLNLYYVPATSTTSNQPARLVK